MGDNYVIIANIEWSFLKQRHQFLAEKLCEKGGNVVFVESSAKRNPELRDVPRIFGRLIKVLNSKWQHKKIDKNAMGDSRVKVISPIVLPSTYKVFRFLNKLFLIKPLVNKIKGNLNKHSRLNVICYLPSSTSLELISLLKPDKLIYDCVSNFEAIKSMPNDTPKIENILLRLSDITFVDCDYLYEKHEKAAKNIRLLEPSVDYDLFSNSRKDKGVAEIRNIGYYGMISDKLDFNLIDMLIESNYKITMIGDVDKGVRLHTDIIQKNAVPASDLPNLLQEFDALIIPYVKNDFMKGVIPAKFFECFATGLPIIVTNLDNYKRYLKYLITGDTYDEIIDNIKKFNDDIENENKRLQRIDIAKKHSWDVFIGQFLEQVN